MKLVIDSSVLVAIAQDEPEAGDFLEVMARFPVGCVVCAATMFETLMVLAGKGYEQAADAIEPLLRRQAITLVPFDAAQVRIANQAFLRFGKGRHPAALNYGDCMAYALARSLDAPLLFKGGDFGKTDIIAAL